ncbi:eukaryotic translation initiation factor 4B2 [Diospyros lotus]|uniref:eukaryotic translation initiation factor 4B2 n=1 Tax=Diospyros lotus TaxID=55363 RepID=UPI00224F04EF|nr:eukaryotic translation initiation factor 4B2 [Diospyros lotus]
MSNPWGNIGRPGAWAAESERAEAEERELAPAAAVGGGGGDSQSFPPLKEATAAKPKKKKMSLQEFNLQTAAGRRAPASGLTHDEMLRLPTGPMERPAGESQYGRLGGGFSNYGRSEGIPGRNFRDRDGDGAGSWGGGRRSYGGFDDERRAQPPARVSDFDQPSRADEVDNWAVNKKQLGSFDSGRPSRYGSLGGGDIGAGGGGMSRADEVDNWAAGKKPITARPSNFVSSSRDAGPEPDRWTRRGFGETERERPRLVLDPPRGEEAVVEVVKSNKPNPFGAARPREEVLAEKGLDWKKMDLEIEAKKTSRPTSSQSSRPSSAQSSRSEGPALQGVEGAVKPRPKLNPFGDAKPREVLLEEKGMDWRKIDMELDHRRVDRPEMEAEKLKNEISHLKKELEKVSYSNANREAVEGPSGEHSSLHDLILSKERDLELLSRELDDKVRFGQKAIERPGSGAGRVSGYPERPPPQSGVSEVVVERPRSRGTGDMWSRQGDDRRVFQGGWGRGSSGNRDINRSRSRERW